MTPATARRTVHAIVVEDSLDDFELLVAELRREGVELDALRVENADEMAQALLWPDLEIVLADWFLPRYSGPAAIAQVQDARPGVPVVVLSGTTDEHTVVLAMKAGAVDFLAKGRLERLPFVLAREIAAAAERARTCL